MRFFTFVLSLVLVFASLNIGYAEDNLERKQIEYREGLFMSTLIFREPFEKIIPQDLGLFLECPEFLEDNSDYILILPENEYGFHVEIWIPKDKKISDVSVIMRKGKDSPIVFLHLSNVKEVESLMYFPKEFLEGNSTEFFKAIRFWNKDDKRIYIDAQSGYVRTGN